jgi:opacity protein-like surface antigen
MIKTTYNKLLTTLAVLTILSGAAANAQDAPEVKAKTWEVGTFAGSSFGLDKYRVMGGANVGYAITKHIFPYAEVSYLPGIGRRETGAGSTIDYELPVTDFHGGVHLRFTKPGWRFVPYGIIGVGMIRIGEGSGKRRQADGRASTEFASNFGAGARVYITERWGFRVEAKVYKPTGRFTDVFGRVAGGLFWQF